MRVKAIVAAALIGGVFGAPVAQAATEIQWWHSMTGALGDKVTEISKETLNKY